MKGLKAATFIIFMIMALMGHAKTITVEVGQFEKLKINGNLSVIYKNLPDSTGFARFETDLDDDDIFTFSTKGEGQLKIEPSDEKWGVKNLPIIYLYSDFLTSLESYSEQHVELVSLAPCSTFSVNLVGNGSVDVNDVKCNNLSAAVTTGNGKIYISGSCLSASFRMVGAGLISADQLRADNVKCWILGTGSIGCWPIDNLNVKGLGSTKIYYKGSPNIKKKGGGKLFELPEDLDEDAYNFLGTPVESLSISASEEDDDEDDEEVETYTSPSDDDEDEDYQTVVSADD